MDPLHVLVLAALQGLTEFLPISSSAHLILVPVVLGWPDQGLAFDVAVHVGTLGAVVAYFRRELIKMSGDFLRSLRLGRTVGDSRLAWGVLIGTIPVGLAGLLVKSLHSDALRAPMVIAAATVGFGLLLWWADRRGRGSRDEHTLSWRDVFVVGLAQALALIPGTSRSGITITAGLALGLSREGAARFSFLLAIPVIVLAGGLEGLEAFSQRIAMDWGAVSLGVAVSFCTALLCIHYFLILVQRVGMMPFIVYRLALGAVLIIFFA